uniref:NYN domain-containing protein n=1 Tax=Noccaea caerulescens TaxID=107243 RepID=A0A1J3IQD1_NOCCA
MMNTKKTSVLWDINGCPVPDGFDPCLVGRRIESALKNSGCCGSGPLTITAIGDLRQTGDEVLRDLSSVGT